MAEIQTEKRIESMGDIIGMASDLMAEVYNDGKMAPAEKIKAFSQGSRVVLGVRAEMRKTALDLSRMGFRVNGNLNALAFSPEPAPETESK